MRQEFLKDTIQSRFIKALLYNAYLPICKTVSTGDYVVGGMTYIWKRNVCRCDKSGYIGQEALMRPIRHYTFGLPYPKFTDNYVSEYEYYDIGTHKRLGEYLRCYRDIFEIDLMPFYNCFTGEYTSGLKITEEGIINKINSTDKIFMIPIKFNKTYTICIDSQSELWMAPAVINNGYFVSTFRADENGVFKEIEMTEEVCSIKGAIKRYPSSSFNTPLIYRLENTNPENELFLQQDEKYLYLIIQVSEKNNSSLAVLEGDYRNLRTKKIVNTEGFKDMTGVRMNEIFLSELNLMMMSDHKSYPFSDRLIEYLLQNVIDKMDPIEQNIKFAQEGIRDVYQRYHYPGVWTNELRQDLYEKYQKDNKYPHRDINGFVDKEMERYIMRTKGIR